MEKESKGIKGGFKTIYSINCIILGIVFFFLISMFLYNPENIGQAIFVGVYLILFYFLNLVVSLILLIPTIILGVSNYKKVEDLDTRKKIKKMLWILGIIHLIPIAFIIWANLTQ